MYGDTAVIRRLGQQRRDQSGDLRRRADSPVGQAVSVDWQGPASTRMRERMRDRATAIGHTILEGVKAVAPDPVDQVLDHFVPPPPGHEEWLDIDVPGLGR